MAYNADTLIVIKSIADIIKIDKNGITFTDSSIINFDECISNTQKIYSTSSTTFIAERDITDTPPYFEFYTSDKHIRIIFNFKGFLAKLKNYKAFLKLQLQIKNLGYTTRDLS